MHATVAELRYYPIKGCAGISTRHSEVLAAGLEHDRTFTVVDGDGACRTQRRYPKLAAVTAEPLHDGAKLALSAPGAGALELDVRFDGRRVPITVFKHSGAAVDQGEQAAAWFSAVLGVPCRLVRVPPDHQRVTTGETAGTAGFADGQAITVASLTSLADLNDRILRRGGEPVPIDRFRPNIVVDGWPEPYTEDRVRRMSIGSAEFAYAKRDIRCQVTLVDQGSGRNAGPEPLRTLADYRRDPEDGGVSFAMKAAVLRPGRITVGDAVNVHQWGAGLTRSTEAAR